MLLTRSRLCPRASPGSSLHLHVLSTPPAFVLSQDQTLREELSERCTEASTRHDKLSRPTRGPYTVAPRSMTGSFYRSAGHALKRRTGRTWTHTTDRGFGRGAHAVEFSKTAAPVAEGIPPQEARSGRTLRLRRTDEYSARRRVPELSGAGLPSRSAAPVGPSVSVTWTVTTGRAGGRRSRPGRSAATSRGELAVDDRDRLGRPDQAARRWAWAFVSWLRRLWS